MKNQHLPQKPKPEKTAASEQEGAADDLKFMRSVIERTCSKIDPGWLIMVSWGLIIMIGFPLGYFIKTRQLETWKWPIYLLLLVISFL